MEERLKSIVDEQRAQMKSIEESIEATQKSSEATNKLLETLVAGMKAR